MRLGAGGTATGTVIAIAGVALALAVMELTLGIVVGFKEEIKRKLMGFDAQVSISAPFDYSTHAQSPTISITPQLDSLIRNNAPGADTRLTLRLPGMLKTDSDFEGIIFTGQTPTGDFAFERGNIVEGTWPDYTQDSCRNDIVLSRATARALGINTGDKIYTSFIIGDALKMRRYRAAGLYEADFGEYDRTIAYASLSALQSVAGLDSLQGNRIELRNLAEDRIEPTAEAIERAQMETLTNGTSRLYYPVETVMQTGAIYFNWLSLLDTNVAVIFCLMLCVAAFTLVSSLFILVLDNVPAIGILRSLGASRRLVRAIFVDLGMRIVLRGMIIGNILAIGLLLIQKHTSFIPLDPEAYYLNCVPVELRFWPFVALNAGVALAAWLVLWIPARTAAKIGPAQTINFE